MTLKNCPDCLREKPEADFPQNASRPDGRGLYCRECMNERSQASYRKRQAAKGRTVRESVGLPAGFARCPDCGEVKDLESFPRNKRTRTGRSGYCRPCHNARGVATYTRLYGSTRNYHLRRRYGITAADYDALVETQGGVCALCQTREPQHVDHDHVTGKVRGVLCSCCNQGLGNFRDDVASLRAAADYLERTTWQRTQICPGVYRLTSPRPGARPSATFSGMQRLICSHRRALCRQG